MFNQTTSQQNVVYVLSKPTILQGTVVKIKTKALIAFDMLETKIQYSFQS